MPASFHIPTFASVLTLLVLAAPARAEPFDAAAVDALINKSLETWRVPGAAVAIVRDGEVIYLKGHGVRALNADDPVTPDTLFPIGSCTKAFTTTAMAMLVDEGKMAWDDHVRKHLSYFHLSDPLADQDVRLRDLVCHRTGLASNDLLWYRAPWSMEEMVRRAGRLPLAQPFRTRFQYQSTMFTAAGLAVASAADQPWQDFVQKRLFDPLGMTESCFTSTAAAKVADRAVGHRLNHLGRPEIVDYYPMPVPNPAGSIHSTARDLSKWLIFQLGDGRADGKRLVSAANLAETHSPQMVIRLEGIERDMQPDTVQMTYGMGWVLQDYRGVGLCSHAGAIDGFRVHFTLIPEKKIGIVLLNNLQHTRMNQALSNSLVDLLLDLPKKDWNAVCSRAVRKAEAAAADKAREREARRKPDAAPSLPLTAYAGVYENPAYGEARVTVEKGALVWSWYQFHTPLDHYQADEFTAPLEVIGSPHVAFTLNAEGNVSAMKVSEPMNAEFRRK
jgi:CubicO group peptidase (beta-lactamase class C family)